MSISVYPPPTLPTREVYEIRNPRIDAFGRARIASPFTLFDSKFVYDKNLEAWEELTAGAGASAHLPNEACVQMTVGTASGDRVVRQTYRYIPYQPGKSRLVMMSGVLADEPKANCRVRIGSFDNHADKSVDSGGDGVFFQLDGTTLSVVLRSYVTGSQVDTVVAQADWNLDTLDGSGDENNPSGITFDVTKSQVFFFDHEWLGAGDVRCGVVIGGLLIYVHQFRNANIKSTAYNRRATLPLRVEIENTGATSGSTASKQICGTVISEGGFEPVGNVYAVSNGITAVGVSTSETPVLSIRLKSGFNRDTINLIGIEAFSTSAANSLIRVRIGASLTGAAFTSVDSNSAVEYDVTASSFTGGSVKLAQYISSQIRSTFANNIRDLFWASSTIAGTSQIITVTAQATVGNPNLFASMQWIELT